jgi:Arylsulfotransferase (ASST)
VMINDTTKSQPGWTLVNVQKGDGSTSARSPAPPMAVMYDAEGKPVWYFIDGTINDRGGAISTQLTDVGVLIGPTWNDNLKTGTVPREVDFEGNVVWSCPTSLCAANTSFSHHASKLPNGHYLLNEDVGSGTTAPRIHELDANGDEVWSLDWTDVSPAPQGATGDWCHGNSISADIEKDILWVNCRWVGFMKINYTAKTKAWLIPASYGSEGQGDFTYNPTNIQFSDAHDPEFHEDDNTVLMFDNGGYGTGATGGSTAMFRSRAVEYTINEDTMTLTLNWEFPGGADVPDAWYTDNWYTPFWGDADRLPNGNVLVAAGIRSPTVESRVFEVTKADKEVVWEFRFPADYGVYRADRITPPLVHPIP